ncbi:MAG: thermonuclease family protein [Sedimentisphaerales bacterium]|nr:thermonuclease family protein [Sedimentisphaerales bacterium]
MSRRSRGVIFILCILTAAAAVWLDHSPIKRNWQARPESKERARSSDFEKYNEHTFTVLKVVDGDTIDIGFPDGENEHTRVRLLGVDTPETKHPEKGVMYFGPEAADFTAESALGKQVTIYLEETRTRDKYNRLLAYIKLPDGEFLNESLLNEGFAYSDARFRHSFFYKYQRLEKIARGQKRGLWKEATREKLPEWLQRKKPKLLL